MSRVMTARAAPTTDARKIAAGPGFGSGIRSARRDATQRKRSAKYRRLDADPCAERKEVPNQVALAWGTGQHTLVASNTSAANVGLDVETEVHMWRPHAPECSQSPSRHIHYLSEEEAFVPDEALYRSYSLQRLKSVDLTIWQEQLSAATVDDILRRNSSFSRLVLRGVRRAYIVDLLTQKFGFLLTEVDISSSEVVNDLWLKVLGTECQNLERLHAARCPKITDKGVAMIARRRYLSMHALSFAGCEKVSDDGVEILAKHCKNLLAIDLSGCPRVRDRSVFALGELADLQTVGLDDCAEISDDALRHLFTNVTQLRSLSLRSCSRVSDEGLQYIHVMRVPWGTREHRNCSGLRILNIGHNNYVSDDFITELVTSCPQLEFLDVTACPLIGGDEAMGRLGDLLELIEVKLQALPRVSDQGIARFFCDFRREALRCLSLSGCIKITDVALQSIAKSGRGLRELRLDRNVSVSDDGLGYLAKGLTHLRVFQITHLGMVTDDGVRLLARKCLRLTELDCSYCLRLTAACLPILRRLRGLESIGLSHCHGLFSGSGGGGIAKDARHEVGGRQGASTTALDAAEFHQLKKLGLSQQPHLTDEALRSVATRNGRTLTSLDVSACCDLTAEGITDALRVLVVLKRLDVTACQRLEKGDIAHFSTCVDARLFLSCASIAVDGFDGLHCCGAAANARARDEFRAMVRRDALSAGTVQRAFRRYKRRAQQEDDERREFDRLTSAAMTIQALTFNYMARRKLHARRMRRARLILRVHVWRRRTKESRIWGRASRHGNRKLLLRTVRDWRAYAVMGLLEASVLVEKGELMFDHCLRRKYLRAWVRFTAPARDKEAQAEEKALRMWCEQKREILFRRWKENTREIRVRRANLVEITLFVLPTEFLNSSHQKPKAQRAVTFHRRRVLRKAWGVFVGLNAELADLHRRFKQFDASNRPRFLRRTFARLRAGTKHQQRSRRAKRLADNAGKDYRRRVVFASLSAAMTASASARLMDSCADKFATKMLVKRGWAVLRDNRAVNKGRQELAKLLEKRSEGHRVTVQRRRGVKRLADHAHQRARTKMAIAKVFSRYVSGSMTSCFTTWKMHHRILKNAAQILRTRGEMLLLVRMFMCWADLSAARPPSLSELAGKQNQASGAEVSLAQDDGRTIMDEDSTVQAEAAHGEPSDMAVREALVDIASNEAKPQVPSAILDGRDTKSGSLRTMEEGAVEAASSTDIASWYPPEHTAAAESIQAAWRGFTTRKSYDEERTARQWAAIKMQSFCRAKKARRIFFKRMRCKRIRDIVSAEGETERMAMADRDSHRLRQYDRALHNLGRVLWGYRGRKLAKERRREARLREASKLMAAKEEALRRHEETQRRLESLRKDEHKAAMILQAAYRSRMARIRVRGIREDNRRRRSATAIQCMVRFRAARHEAAARNRQKERTAYVHRGRKGQARFLRMVGLRHRKPQRRAIRLLRKVGADLMGFTTSLRIQREDLRDDLRLALHEFNMHREAFRVGGRDAFRRKNYMRARQLDNLERRRVRRGDAVKILDRSHEFCGFTGRVLHIDARDPGREVAEVKLDDGTERVAYVRLLTFVDKQDGVPRVNMLKIDRMELVQRKPEQLALLQDALLVWADKEREWWSLHLAAVAIQRRCRGYLTRRATARKRHQYWTRERASRLVFLRGLGAAHIATYQAVRAAVMLRVIKPTEVPTNMPWVPHIPPRLEEVAKLRRNQLILAAEMRTRMAERARLVAEKPDKLQWKSPTHGPLMRHHHPAKEAWANFVTSLTHPPSLTDILQKVAGRSCSDTIDLTAQARTVYTRSFLFKQLEQSPHVRTGGRAMFHGSWARICPISSHPETSAASSSSGSDAEDGSRADSWTTSEGKNDGPGKRSTGNCARQEEGALGTTDEGNVPVRAMIQRAPWRWPRLLQRKRDIEQGKDIGVQKSTGRETRGEDARPSRRSARSGKSLLVPHGEGYVEFLDGWGVSREEKTLYVTVLAAKDLAGIHRSMVIQHCDPFFQLQCNGKTQRTSTKHATREPRYNEMFEFDVSNPASVLCLECWEEDTFSTTYIGGVVLPLRELSNGRKVHNWFPLETRTFRKEEKMSKLKGKAKGSVELALQWLPKATEDDVSIRIRLSKAAVALQCWARTIIARRVADEAATDARAKASFAFATTLKVQLCWRGHSARETLRIKKMHYRNACILQKFARRKLAYVEAAWKRLCRDKSITIQCLVRQRQARAVLARLREERRILERAMATRIQANARGKLARMYVVRKKQAVEEGGKKHQADEAVPVAEWLHLYGTDPYYPSRRVRRITERIYFKILGTAGSIVVSNFGTATVVRYPCRACTSERVQDKGASLRDTRRFVEVMWHAHANLHWPHKEREMISKNATRRYRGFLELASVPADRTVGRRATTVQCMARMWMARRTFRRRRRTHDSAIAIQRAYRQYADARARALRKLQSTTRRYLARRIGGRLAREKRSVIAVQCAYRSRKARLAAAYKRVIKPVKVTGSSGCSDPRYGPGNCVVLDPSEESSIWTSPYGEVSGQWIEFDLGSSCPVGALHLLAMSNTTCPKQVRVECCKTKKQAKSGEWTLAGSFRAAQRAAWQLFKIPRKLDGSTIARWWKVTFVSNYGNTTALAVNGVQFLLAKEESPRVLSQSHSSIVTPPAIGEDAQHVVLRAEGTAWPPHRYQWFRNGRALNGATQPHLDIRLYSAPTQECQPFRCIHCKHAKDDVPRNARRVVCGNCNTPYVFPEYEDTLDARSAWERELTRLETITTDAERLVDEKVVARNRALLEASICADQGKTELAEAKAYLAEMDVTLAGAQEELHAAREVINAKHRELRKSARDDPLKVRHDFEGMYECRLSNTRGGSIVRTVSSFGIYIFARDPPPLRLKVRVKYLPKTQVRRRYWPKYAWAFGWFVYGRFGGNILFKFHDGAVYDGPYVPEACLSLRGSVPAEAREPGHWGTWITKNGWTYEGPSVDNHFDIDCISGVYRLTTPAGEVYEGDMLDEEKHGTGEYRYADGTVYVGEWHRGQRQGFGAIVAPDGAAYEGEFDHDIIHGEGVWTWPDGSRYAGHASHGYREGMGLYVTDMRDTFYGEFRDNRPHGKGIARYCDGSSYVGEFNVGKRHGKGTLEDVDGVKIAGTWSEDKRDGVFEVKLRTPVFIPELDECQDEIRTGLWESGEFVEWLSAPMYPYATKQFYEMFEKDDSAYDGVYAMLVAKKLPDLPRGVDPSHSRIVACVRRIANEAGQLCASDTIAEAKKQVADATGPHEASVSRLRSTEVLARASRQEHLNKQNAVNILQQKYDMLLANKGKLEAEVEQFYLDDPGKSRESFFDALTRLKTISGADWFLVRNYDEPPPVLAALMSAVCTLMLVRDSWKSARNLVGSSVQNMEEGDEEALHIRYDCKLVHRLENEFSPYTRCNAPDVMMKLAAFVVDPRFEGESLFLKLYGDALGPLADTVKSAYNYIVKAAEIKPSTAAISGVDANIKYTATCLERQRHELDELDKQAQSRQSAREEAQAAEEKARAHVDKAKTRLCEAQALVTAYVPPRGELDPYELLEADLNPKLTEVEVMLELVIRQVEARLKGTATEVPEFKVVPAIAEQTGVRVAAAIAEGVYSFSAGTVQCHDERKIASVKSGIVDQCKRGINACLRDKPPNKGEWTMLGGERVRECDLENLLDRQWDASLRQASVHAAVENWTRAFPAEGEAAYQALLSPANQILSDERKAEARLWLKHNTGAVEDTLWLLANQFAERWPEHTAEGCVQVLDGNDFGEEVRLQATAWEKHNSDAVREYRAETLERMAGEFAVMWTSEGEAAQQVIQIRENEDEFQRPYADAWASFHLNEMITAEADLAKTRANAFEDRHPEVTARKAVKAMVAFEERGELTLEGAVETREALAWCALHARASAGAEEELAVDLTALDIKVDADVSALEHRLERLREKESEQESADGEVACPDGGVPLMDAQASRQRAESREPRAVDGAAGASATPTAAVVSRKLPPAKGEGGKTRKAKGVKKSKAQQFAEKEQADRKAREEEEEQRRHEAEAAEAALRNRPRSKVEQVTELLASKLTERRDLCDELLLLLRRAQKKAQADDSPQKALTSSEIRPSERQSTHDELKEKREKFLNGIGARIADLEAKVAQVRQKLDGIDNVASNDDGTAVGDHEPGWESFLDETSGQYYWYNEHTGEAYYAEGENE